MNPKIASNPADGLKPWVVPNDMLRISVPLGLIKTGDIVSLDVNAGRLNVKLDEAEMAKRRAAWKPPEQKYTRSYAALYKERVGQANKGSDFDFLEGTNPTPEPEIY